MSRDEKDAKAIDSKEELKMANERRIEELLNINNRYVRTQRHLEQYSDISDPENLRHASRIQEERKDRMENLKNIIAYGKHDQVDDVENLEKNLEYTQGYVENNASHMDEFSLRKTLEKQAHRKEQLEFLD
ncbi:MAG: hypothetical protein WBI74_02820 [Caldicoprobacterales bacterium]|nr:hypothetical protein [Clostridiales bacterium]